MSEDLEALLREHYRRAAEGIMPDANLVARTRRAARPAAVRTWPWMLATAAAVAVIAAVTWGLLRPGHSSTPVAPPPATVSHSPSPAPPPPTATSPARPTAPPRRLPLPHPTVTRAPSHPPLGTMTLAPVPSPSRAQLGGSRPTPQTSVPMPP